MSKKRSRKHYAVLLRGLADKRPGEYAGIRSYATGFIGADGYDLRKFNQWTPAQKAKLSRYAQAVMESRARPHIEYRIGNAGHDQTKLERAKKQFNAPIKAPQLKVAFVPFTPPRTDPTYRPKLQFDDSGITIVGKHYTKTFAPFDHMRLATDPKAEVLRVAKSLGDKHLTLQTGLYESGSFLLGTTFAADVMKLMQKYNGTTTPRGKGKNWNPKNHKWQDWLLGLNGYNFAPGGKQRDLDYLRDKAKAREIGIKRGKTEARRRRNAVADADFLDWLSEWAPGKTDQQMGDLQGRLIGEGRKRELNITRRYFAEMYRKEQAAKQADEWQDDEEDEEDE